MLRIAVVSNSFREAKRFVDCKFEGKIERYNATSGSYILKNGDTLDLCYDESRGYSYASFEFDAFMVVPSYSSLLDIVIHRQMRP